MTTIADLRAISTLRIETVEATRPMPTRRERDLRLTDLEQHVIAELLDQLQSSPFIRRSIIRKMDLSSRSIRRVHDHGLRWRAGAG